MLPCHIEPPVEGRRDSLQSEAVSGIKGRAGEQQRSRTHWGQASGFATVFINLDRLSVLVLSLLDYCKLK